MKKMKTKQEFKLMHVKDLVVGATAQHISPITIVYCLAYLFVKQPPIKALLFYGRDDASFSRHKCIYQSRRFDSYVLLEGDETNLDDDLVDKAKKNAFLSTSPKILEYRFTSYLLSTSKTKDMNEERPHFPST